MPIPVEAPKQGSWGPFMCASYISEDSLRHYEKQCNESQGFDVDCLPLETGTFVRPLVPLTPARMEMHKLKPLTDKAVEFYNSKNPNPADHIKNPRIVKVNYILSAPFTYFITFKARDASGKRKTYQTEVESGVDIDHSDIVLCRLKPKKEKKKKKKKEKKRKRSSTKGEALSTSSAEPANADPDLAHEADESVEPLNNTGNGEEQGEDTAQSG